MSPEALRRAFTENRASTDPRSEDEALRGRTYAISFERVWSAALSLADGGLRGWSVVRSDDEEGVIEAEAVTLVFRFVDDVRIRIALDANAQTRVDLTSRSRVGKADLGTNRRRIRRFCRALDERLGAGPREILDTRASADLTV